MSVVIRFADEPVESRIDLIKHVVGDAYAPLDIRPAVTAAELHDQLVMADFGAIRVMHNSVSPTEIVRTPKLIRRSDPEFCKIDIMMSGQMLIEQDGRHALLEPGEFGFFDLSRPCRLVTSAAQFVAVVFPRALLSLPYRETGRITALPISGRRGTGSLVVSLANQVAAEPDAYDAAGQSSIGTALLDLVSAALATRIDGAHLLAPEAGRRALLEHIYTFIERHMAKPDLSPATIAAAHHISVRYLHKLFESEETTVADRIRRRRLERCRRELLDPQLGHQPVNAVGARWGFSNPTTFTRAFRAAYNVPPSQYRHLQNGTIPR